MTVSPGTVSKILWHFTGAPKWDDETNAPASKLKSDDEAYSALHGILSERQLRLSTYNEAVKHIKSIDDRVRYENLITTTQVCCVAEIPIQHLSYHADRYGKFAIGFYRDRALDAGFRPVIYAIEDDWIVYEIQKAWLRVFNDRPQTIFSTPESEDHPDDTEQHKQEKKAFKSWYTRQTEVNRLLAHTKTFNVNEFDTIYSEREWRNLEAFNFSYEDVFMVVLPKAYVPQLKKDIDGLATEVPLVAYEDLLEH